MVSDQRDEETAKALKRSNIAQDEYHSSLQLHCRCMICGSREGHTLRCCGANCHVRAHLICASYTKEWKVITLYHPAIAQMKPKSGSSSTFKKNGKDQTMVKAMGFVCSTHRVFDATIEDEEDVDYFES